jgi:hypothetical protein
MSETLTMSNIRYILRIRYNLHMEEDLGIFGMVSDFQFGLLLFVIYLIVSSR